MSLHILQAVAALLALSSQIDASPVLDVLPREDLEYGNLLGFDPTVANARLAPGPIPDALVIDVDTINRSNVSETTPFIPENAEVADEAELQRRFIVGEDDRHIWTSTDYPFRTVGRVTWSNGIICSGTLVGPRHVLSAQHCIVEGQSATFAPSFNNGPRLGQSAITAYAYVPRPDSGACRTKFDWVVFLLADRLGDTNGWMGVKTPDWSRIGEPIYYHMGYPVDLTNGQQPIRQLYTRGRADKPFDCDSTGPFYSDTDTWGGQSGGPFWEIESGGVRSISGALSITVQSSTDTFAGWGSGQEMVNTVSSMRTDFP